MQFNLKIPRIGLHLKRLAILSIIPVVAKVFERIIYNQVYAFLVDNYLLTSSQSGFRSLHSTVTALFDATNCWPYNIDSGNVNSVVFLDLKKLSIPWITRFFYQNCMHPGFGVQQVIGLSLI